jgi:ankyrin repeat protein
MQDLNRNRCAYDYAWRKTLGGGEDALSLRKLRLLFSEDEYLDTHELTFLQRVVIGTIPLSLNGVLNNMPVSEINRTDADGRTALIWAATRGDHSCVELLLGRGATHQMVVRKSLTALTEAAISGNEQCVKLLVEAGADINYTNSRGYTALHEAARSHDNPAVVAILLEHSANINSQTKWNAMALMYATHSMHHRTAAYLINYGADYHLRDLDGVSALCYSIWKNDLATLRLLLGKGADHTIRTNNGMTVLHYAAWDGDIHTIQILIQARLTGIDVSAVARGVTALQAAESRVERAWGVSGEWMEGFNALWESAQPITLRNCEAPRDFEDDAASREDMFVDALEQQEILNYGSTPLQTS